MSKTVIALAGAALVSGCVKSADVEYPPESERIVGVAEMQQRGGPFSIGVYDGLVEVRDKSVIDNVTPCPRLSPDATVTLGGAAMKIDPGGAYDTDAGDIACRAPSMELSYPTVFDAAQLVFSDYETTIRCDLGNALAKRSVELVSTSEWKFTPGEPVTLAWSPVIPWIGDGFVAFLQPDHGGPRVEASKDAQGRVTLTIPAGTSPGAYTLYLGESTDNATDDDATIEVPCPELGSVRMGMHRQLDEDITIVPST